MDIKISIIVPCYNQGNFLSEALESILAQGYSNWECIIINDGSNDDTDLIAKRYSLLDDRFIYLKKKNGGLSSARNVGLKIANGDWIQFLDADDLLPNSRFDLLVNTIHNIKDIDVIVSNFNLLDLNKLILPYCTLKQEYLNLRSIILGWDINFTIPIHCGLFKYELFNHIVFNENLEAKEDWYMWTTLFLHNPKAYYLDKILALYRINNNSMSRNEHEQSRMLKNELKAFLSIKDLLLDEELCKTLIETRLDHFVSKITTLNDAKKAILSSNSYKLGNFLLKPLSIIRNTIDSLLKSK